MADLDEKQIRAHLQTLYSGVLNLLTGMNGVAQGLEILREQLLAGSIDLPADIRRTVDELGNALAAAQVSDLALGAIRSYVGALQEPKAQR
jgi:hypothetical protein